MSILNINNLSVEYIGDKSSTQALKNISIDVAVMEKTKRGIVIPLDVGWSDVGSWEVIWDTSKKDIVFSGDWNSCYHYLIEKERQINYTN